MKIFEFDNFDKITKTFDSFVLQNENVSNFKLKPINEDLELLIKRANHRYSIQKDANHAEIRETSNSSHGYFLRHLSKEDKGFALELYEEVFANLLIYQPKPLPTYQTLSYSCS